MTEEKINSNANPYVEASFSEVQPYVAPDAKTVPEFVPPAPTAPPVKKNSAWSFTTVQKTFAFVALILGYIFNRFVFHGTAPGLGATVFFEVALVSALVYLQREGSRLRAGNYLWFAVLMLYPVSFILFDNPTAKVWGVLFMIVASMFWVYSSASGIGVFRQTFVYDFFRSTFAAPFRNFVAQPVAMFKPAKDQKTRVLRYVLLGLLIAIPFTAIIAALLISSDETFAKMIGIENVVDEIYKFFFRLIFAVPVAMMIFSVCYSAVRNRDAVSAKKSSYKGGRGNHIIFVTALIPVILLYVVYFISQFAYFTGAFVNMLPAELTYSEYARQGFFELCAVVVINLLMILLTVLLCKKNDNGRYNLSVKFVISVLSLFSAMLVAITVAKMVMYTSAYGLTHKRIYTLWFTLVLLCLVAVALLKILFPKFKFWNGAVSVVVILFVLLSFANVDAIIAKYNVQWYQQGKISWMGEELLYDLDKSAVKYLDALYEDDTEVLNEVDSRYHDYSYTYYDKDDMYDSWYDDAKETVGAQIKDYYKYLASYDNDIVGFNLSAYSAERVFDRRSVVPYTE